MLLYCLIVLTILLVGSVATIRSFNSSLFNAGNIAFKRDMLNQGERAAVAAMALFAAGGELASSSSRWTSRPAKNYSAAPLPVNRQGIPLALISDSSFSGVGSASNDISDAASRTTVRYVVDRLCSKLEKPSQAPKSPEQCVYAPSNTQVAGGTAMQGPSALPPLNAPMYRLSVRVTGPRDTQVFVQISFTQPE